MDVRQGFTCRRCSSTVTEPCAEGENGRGPAEKLPGGSLTRTQPHQQTSATGQIRRVMEALRYNKRSHTNTTQQVQKQHQHRPHPLTAANTTHARASWQRKVLEMLPCPFCANIGSISRVKEGTGGFGPFHHQLPTSLSSAKATSRCNATEKCEAVW